MANIGVKEAVKAAKEVLLELYEDDPPVALQSTNNHIGAVFTPTYSQVENRVCKTLFIDAVTGSFVKMDIRQVH